MLAANAGDGGPAAALTARRAAATDRDDGRRLHELTVNVMGADQAACPARVVVR
jgi:hypothetical protein